MAKDYSDLLNDDGLAVKGVNAEEKYDGAIIRVYREEVELPDGKHAHWDVVRHLGAVCVVPIDEDGNVILVRQYRYPAGRVMLEIPAGKLESKDDDRLLRAKKELKEETGAICEEMICLGDIYTTPAYVDERITMYLAKGLTFGDTHLDEGEFLTSLRMPLEDAVRLVCDGKIEDAKTQAALLRVWVMKLEGRL